MSGQLSSSGRQLRYIKEMLELNIKNKNLETIFVRMFSNGITILSAQYVFRVSVSYPLKGGK